MQNDRMARANALLQTIASHGHQFFRHNGTVSQLTRDRRGRIWFCDAYTKKRIYTHTNHRWRGFTEGGTLRSLVMQLRDWIAYRSVYLSPHTLGPWPAWVCEGDLWGYGDAMLIIREKAIALQMLQAPVAAMLADPLNAEEE